MLATTNIAHIFDVVVGKGWDGLLFRFSRKPPSNNYNWTDYVMNETRLEIM